MTFRAQKSDANKGNIIAYPSLANSLCNLPGAIDMDDVELHPSTNASAEYNAESEAKLARALSRKTSSFTPQNSQSFLAYKAPHPDDPNSSDCSSSLFMMRKSKRPKQQSETHDL